VNATVDPVPPPSCRAGAPGVCVPGTGAPRTDCFTEWLVQPIPPLASRRVFDRSVPSYRVTCTDGDPRCDFDGVAGKNGRCTLHVAVCANNGDPRPAARRCLPTALASYRLLSPSPVKPRDAADAANAGTLLQTIADLSLPVAGPPDRGQITFAPAFAAPDRCSPLQDLVVPVGTRVLRTRATATDKRTDTDQLRLKCVK
jgi:hypothetical protein